jgi:DNA transformation protein
LGKISPMSPISSIRNLGPATEAAFLKAGIQSAEELRAIGADAGYARLLEAGERPHFIGYYVLHMALQGRPWSDCKGAEKEALRIKFDALKATAFDKGRSELETFMRDIGLIERKPR